MYSDYRHRILDIGPSLAQRSVFLDGIHILPWREFLGRLWAGDIVAGG